MMMMMKMMMMIMMMVMLIMMMMIMIIMIIAIAIIMIILIIIIIERKLLSCAEQVQAQNIKHMHVRRSKQHVSNTSCSNIQLSGKDG